MLVPVKLNQAQIPLRLFLLGYQLDMGICEFIHNYFCPEQVSSLQIVHKLLEGGVKSAYGAWPQGRVLVLLLLSCVLA